MVAIHQLDGETGESLGEVDVADWNQNWGHGTYGGATDKNRDFWGLGTNGTLVRVDAETLQVTRWDNPQAGRVVYGVALDQHGDPWLGGWDGSLWRFDIAAQAWEDRGQVGDPYPFSEPRRDAAWPVSYPAFGCESSSSMTWRQTSAPSHT